MRSTVLLVDDHDGFRRHARRVLDGDGFSLAESLAALDHPPVVILTSSYDPTEFEPLAAASPARGFVPKDKLSRTAIDALLKS